MPLHPDFLSRPLAHRGLHDAARGIAENSMAGFAAAIAAGYGIELDLQLSADGQAMVFHDADLERMTEGTGPLSDHHAAALGGLRLADTADGIPTLREVLDMVDGRVPVLIEIKDQHGALGETSGILERDAARTVAAYRGPVAVMSFNPEAVAAFHRAAPGVTVGLTTTDFTAPGWERLSDSDRARLTRMDDLARVRADFVSHDRRDLDSRELARVKAGGMPVLCWTVRSPAEEAEARKVADNITFEDYRP